MFQASIKQKVEKDHKDDMDDSRDTADTKYLKQVTWDASHWLNLAVTDLKEDKIGTSKVFFSNFVERTNVFADVLNRGEGKLQVRV